MTVLSSRIAPNITRSLSSLLGSGFSKYCSRRESGNTLAIRKNVLQKNRKIVPNERKHVPLKPKERSSNYELQFLILLSSSDADKESNAIFSTTFQSRRSPSYPCRRRTLRACQTALTIKIRQFRLSTTRSGSPFSNRLSRSHFGQMQDL